MLYLCNNIKVHDTIDIRENMYSNIYDDTGSVGADGTYGFQYPFSTICGCNKEPTEM